jgi:hypothetical protein
VRVSASPLVAACCDNFLNLYGFCRNTALVGLFDFVVLYWSYLQPEVSMTNYSGRASGFSFFVSLCMTLYYLNFFATSRSSWALWVSANLAAGESSADLIEGLNMRQSGRILRWALQQMARRSLPEVAYLITPQCSSQPYALDKSESASEDRQVALG